MNKFILVASREFLTRVKKKSFIILTVLMPFIFAALVFVPIWLSSIKDNDQKDVAVSDVTGKYVGLFKNDQTYRYVPISDPDNKAYYADTSRFEAVIDIRADLVHNPKAVTIYSRNEVAAGLLSYVNNVLNEKICHDKLEATGIKGIEKILSDVQSEISVPTMKRSADGSTTSSDTNIAIAAGFIFTFLIYMFVMSYGGMVMQSVMEEKTNRIVELMVSSVKPFQLMMGKIVGIACVGFVQLAIWGVMLVVILTAAGFVFGVSGADMAQTQQMGMAGMSAAANSAVMQAAIPSESQQLFSALLNLPYAELGTCFVLYFIGGYLLYASFFAAIGASVNEQEDSSQFMMPVIIIMIFGLYAAMGSAENTNGPLAFWSSMFPLTSPIVMMVRIPFNVPVWQELLSLGILYATALFFVWCSARIYRVGILMYGKKPSIKEMIKWMRYK